MLKMHVLMNMSSKHILCKKLWKSFTRTPHLRQISNEAGVKLCCLELELSRLSIPRWGKQSFLWDHPWGHWEQATVVSENPYSSNRFSISTVPERIEMDFPPKFLGKGNNKNDPKDSADFLVKPTKSPCIQTRAPSPARRATPHTVQTTFVFILSHT